MQCQPERPQVCPTATGFSSSCSKASYPRMCILKDCVRNREITHRNVTLAQKKFWWLQLWTSSVLRSTVNNAVKFRCLIEVMWPSIENTAVVFRSLTLSSAGQRSPSYIASRTHSRTQRRSYDYSSHRSSWWCRPHSGDMALCHRLRDTDRAVKTTAGWHLWDLGRFHIRFEDLVQTTMCHLIREHLIREHLI